jgi:hypothetical protein
MCIKAESEKLKAESRNALHDIKSAIDGTYRCFVWVNELKGVS